MLKEKEINLFNKKEQSLERQRQELMHALAARLHKEWRNLRFKKDGSFEPRHKKTKDKKWIEEHGGNDDIDIANTDFEDLPKDWQEENLLSAKVAIEKIEDVLYIIHDKWLDRNEEFAEENQKMQYSRLPNDEKIKDIEILEEAIKIMRGQL